MKTLKKLTALTLALLLALSLVACGASSAQDSATSPGAMPSESTGAAYDYKNESAAMPEMEESITMDSTASSDAGYGGVGGAGGNITAPTDGRKVILTADGALETKEYDKALQSLLAAVQASGGYLAGRQDYEYGTRETFLELRIPSAGFAAFLSGLGDIANVVRLTQSSEDITESYLETESYLKSLTTQQNRLLELLEKAESLEDMLAIEDRLAQVRAQLQYYDSLKNSYDSRITYSTVNLTLCEVRDYTVTQPTFGEELLEVLRDSGRGFVNFLEDLLFALIGLAPYLLIIVPAALLARRALKKRKARKAAEKAAAETKPE